MVTTLGSTEPGLLVVFPQDGRQLPLHELMVRQDPGRFRHVAPTVVRHM